MGFHARRLRDALSAKLHARVTRIGFGTSSLLQVAHFAGLACFYLLRFLAGTACFVEPSTPTVQYIHTKGSALRFKVTAAETH